VNTVLWVLRVRPERHVRSSQLTTTGKREIWKGGIVAAEAQRMQHADVQAFRVS
jgi:hypothetical protein